LVNITCLLVSDLEKLFKISTRRDSKFHALFRIFQILRNFHYIKFRFLVSLDPMEEIVSKMNDTLNLSHRSVTLPPSFQKYEVTHAATTNSATWREALAGSHTPQNGYLLTKTLVFKPKVAKSQTARLIVVVALDDTATSAAQIAKAADEKEARFANADVVKGTLGVTVEQGFHTPPPVT
jgi:hypothetical protein